jgi:hypothetical protein
MDLYDVMTTTFASRDFTDEPLPDDTLFKILVWPVRLVPGSAAERRTV